MRSLILSVLVAMIVGISGCSQGESNEQRLKRLVPNASKTTPVSGIVTVDGAPVKDIWVTLHSVAADMQVQPRDLTDETGRFEITTYMEGDGAPAGEYNITVEWLTYRPFGSQWVGPDKLKDQFNDAKTTPFHVTVADTPVELPPFELKLAGVESKTTSKDEPQPIFKKTR